MRLVSWNVNKREFMVEFSSRDLDRLSDWECGGMLIEEDLMDMGFVLNFDWIDADILIFGCTSEEDMVHALSHIEEIVS